MVQTLEGFVRFFSVTADNDRHSEVLSGGSFDVLQEGYAALYVLENFQGLFIPKPGAPGILTFGYHCTSLRDHPLHCQGHSYTEGSDRVSMYPTRLGLVETGVSYTETMHMVRRGKPRHHTVIRKYNELFKHSGYQATTVDTWGGLHFLPLIMSIFPSHHEKNSFVNQFDSGVFGFDKCKGTSLFGDPTDGRSVASNDPYQAYIIAPIVKGRFHYIGVSLVYKPASIGAGHIAKCKMFLNSFFSSFGDLPHMDASEVYLLRKCQGIGPLSRALPMFSSLLNLMIEMTQDHIGREHLCPGIM